MRLSSPRPNTRVILERLRGLRKQGKGWVAGCPAHDDSSPSLSIGESSDGKTLLHCFAGCEAIDIVRALGLSMDDLCDRHPRRAKVQRVTVDQLANAKRLPAQLLRSVGVEEFQGRVRIPYFDKDGNPSSRYRLRSALRAKDGSSWNKSQNGLVLPYGLWKPWPEQTSARLILVEGESDCWTLWHHGFPALGIPGASMGGCLQADHLFGAAVLYLVQESDHGGQHFITNLVRRLSELRFRGEVQVVSLPAGFKDPNDLHSHRPADFKLVFEALLQEAMSIDLHGAAIPPALQRVQPMNDVGNGRRFALMFSGKVRFCRAIGRWFLWDGQRWAVDTVGAVERLAKKTASSIYKLAAQVESKESERALAYWALRSGSYPRLLAMLQSASSEALIAVDEEDLDREHWLLNCLNGTVDLRTGVLQPHDQANLITKLAPVRFDPDAHCEIWDRFLAWITAGNQDLAEYLQRAAGYSLTGDTREEALFLLHGPAASGKSTFLEAVKAVLGDYAKTADFETLLRRPQVGGPRADIARLRGARTVLAIEVDEGKELSEGLIKSLTGGDTVTVRRLYQDAFEFKPTFKLWLGANHAPRVSAADSGIWRRLHRIPMEQVIPSEARDSRVKAYLSDPAEAGPAILRWMVEGTRKWLADGLRPPDVVVHATQSYREEMDPLADFFSERCQFGASCEVPASLIRRTYLAYQEELREKHALSPQRFAEQLKARGCVPARRGKHRERWWSGVGLRTPTVARTQSDAPPTEPTDVLSAPDISVDAPSALSATSAEEEEEDHHA